MIAAEELRQVFPNAKVGVDVINAAMAEFGIDNETAFLSQVGHESAHLTRFVENLNYSAQGLLNTFPKYFDAQTAQEYARQPERIANRVYANRMGNGDEASGDGWKHRGAGGIQTTGADNQRAVAGHFGISFSLIGEWLQTPEGAMRSAAYFWHSNGLEAIADRGDIKLLTKRVNGGLNGLNERMALFEKLQAVLA